MKQILFAVMVLSLLPFALGAQSPSPDAPKPDMKALLAFAEASVWTGQDSLLLRFGDVKVWVDPYKIIDPVVADLILITHKHDDHYSQGSVQSVSDPEKTVIVGPADVIADVRRYHEGPTAILLPGETLSVVGLELTGIPAYNLVKKQFHAKGQKWLGYLIAGEGLRVYVTGDTERIPEMKDVKADIVFIPLGQTYTMGSLDEASKAALDTGARLAVPVHYGFVEGKDSDAKDFKKLLKKKMEVKILSFR